METPQEQSGAELLDWVVEDLKAEREEQLQAAIEEVHPAQAGGLLGDSADHVRHPRLLARW